jgi:hypothetical protein
MPLPPLLLLAWPLLLAVESQWRCCIAGGMEHRRRRRCRCIAAAATATTEDAAVR